MASIQCTSCYQQLCVGNKHQEKDFCPSHRYPEVFDEANKIYSENTETRRMAKNAAIMESRGYMIWPRLKDIIEFAKSMDFNTVAILFCPDLWPEAKKTGRILTENGFTIISMVCGINKLKPQLPEETMLKVNQSSPDMIMNAGLCIPFEAEVLKLSDVPVTTFIARDRKLNNYPALAVYGSGKWRDWAKEVYRDKLGLQ